MGLMDKAKEAAKAAAEAAQKGLDEAKDAGQAFQLKRKLAGLAEEVGETVYRQREGESGLDDEVDRLIEEMRAVKAEIASLAEE